MERLGIDAGQALVERHEDVVFHHALDLVGVEPLGFAAVAEQEDLLFVGDLDAGFAGLAADRHEGEASGEEG
jgi:hypothetical protein